LGAKRTDYRYVHSREPRGDDFRRLEIPLRLAAGGAHYTNIEEIRIGATGRRWSGVALGALGSLSKPLLNQRCLVLPRGALIIPPWSFHMTAYDDLRALFINCSLKRSTEPSHTQRLMDLSISIMAEQGIATSTIRAADLDIPPGVYPDMSEHGWDTDGWPEVQRQVMAADILVIGTPIWLGDKSSICTRVIERLYGSSDVLNPQGQYAYYGRVGGCIVTGNEDGIKHCAMNVLYSLQHLGYVIPPQADAGWIGEAGPGPSYGDEGRVGLDNEFTQRNTTFMAWNLMHLARMLKDAGGVPARGNQRSAWDRGERASHPNREYR